MAAAIIVRGRIDRGGAAVTIPVGFLDFSIPPFFPFIDKNPVKLVF